jgi:hypothetical protein
MKDGDTGLPGMAALICKDYLVGNAALCDQLTVDAFTLNEAVGILKLKDGVTMETSGPVIRNAFNSIWEKVHMQLRLEYVPRFLVSDAFKEIKKQFHTAMNSDGTPGGVEDKVDPVQESINAMLEMDISYILKEPLALDCFESFLRHNQTQSKDLKVADQADEAWTLVCLFQEIDHLRSCNGADVRKRAQKIHLR